MKADELLSPVAQSNIFTMSSTYNSTNDHRQKVPILPMLPSQESRELRARLILEEALETINALGFRVETAYQAQEVRKDTVNYFPVEETNREFFEIVDGCCDLIYVATGTLVSMGIPDLPHLKEVNRANNDKFPDGKAIVNEHGKYLKPEGWIGPDHSRVYSEHKCYWTFTSLTREVLLRHDRKD